MEPIYTKYVTLESLHCDRFGVCKASALAYLVQEAAGEHCQLLNLSWQELKEKRLFWAILRHRLQITRLPREGETLRLETWPMPTTRTAYPRSVIAYDGENRELFRSIGLWVLMDPDTRSMVVPGKSGVLVPGILRGTELSVPGALVPGILSDSRSRRVCFTDLDINGHMNNARYLDWLWDLLPSAFHAQHPPRELTLCYLAEVTEGEELELRWQLHPDSTLKADLLREGRRVFSAHIQY